MREIVLDTETTGISPRDGHRIVEIGCIELLNHVPTGEEYHCYINPQRDMPSGAFDVHGLSEEFLSDKPLFQGVFKDFLEFIDDAPLIIHNASFDMGFLNAELKMVGSHLLPGDRAIDTLSMARKKFPGSPNNLDALCRRFNIDTSVRDKHGALIDSLLLAQVYLELIGGKQPGLELAGDSRSEFLDQSKNAARAHQPRPRPLEPQITDEEKSAHKAFVTKYLGDDALWHSNKA